MSRKLDDDLQEQIRYFKTNYPRMSAAAIYRQLKTDGSIINGQVSESTVCRFVNQLQNELRQTTKRIAKAYRNITKPRDKDQFYHHTGQPVQASRKKSRLHQIPTLRCHTHRPECPIPGRRTHWRKHHLFRRKNHFKSLSETQNTIPNSSMPANFNLYRLFTG